MLEHKQTIHDLPERNREAGQDIDALLEVLPPHIFQAVHRSNRVGELLEIVMDLGREPEARFLNGEIMLSSKPVSFDDIEHVISRVGAFGEDNRAGIERTLHRISAIRNRAGLVVGLTLRVGRAVYGTIGIIQDIVESGQSILLLGRPGVGKTTMLREVARVLADDFKKRVVIVDTSNEIGGDGDIPHPAIGRSRRMQVQAEPPARGHDRGGRESHARGHRHRRDRHRAGGDGGSDDRGAGPTGGHRARQHSRQSHAESDALRSLIGGIQAVTLSDEEARRRGTQKTVLERKAPPTFDVVVEIGDWSHVTVHSNVAETVDAILRGHPVRNEVRTRADGGKVEIREQETDRAENSAPPSTEIPSARAVSQEVGLRVFPFGISRSRLEEAIRDLRVPVSITNRVEDADLVMTLKNYYRRKAPVVRDAELEGVPVYVLKNNTIAQMESALAGIYEIGRPERDNTTAALEEAEQAIAQVLNHSRSIELRAQNSHVRRQQHALAERYNVGSKSRGREPNRRVQLFPRQYTDTF